MSNTTIEPTAQTVTPPFQYQQKTFAIDDIAGMTQAMHDDGFVIIPNVLSPLEVEELKGAIDRLPFEPEQVSQWMPCVFNREKIFLDYIDRPGIVDLAEATMGKSGHIIGESAWRSHPGHNGWRHTPTACFLNCRRRCH
jgi:hypothetical protein